jgi:hypothetical protein
VIAIEDSAAVAFEKVDFDGVLLGEVDFAQTTHLVRVLFVQVQPEVADQRVEFELLDNQNHYFTYHFLGVLHHVVHFQFGYFLRVLDHLLDFRRYLKLQLNYVRLRWRRNTQAVLSHLRISTPH